MPGQEGIPAVYSPMTRTLEDLEMFWRAIMGMKPWEYDHSVRARRCRSPRLWAHTRGRTSCHALQVLPLPWREVDLASGKPIRWGVLWDDGERLVVRGLTWVSGR